MNKKFLFLILLSLLFVNKTVCSDDALILPDPNKSQSNVKEDRYNKLFSFLENKINNIENTKYKKEAIGSWKDDDKIVMFYAFQAQKISDIMFVINYALIKELNSSKNDEEKKFISKKIEQLNELRKKHALKFECILDNLNNIKIISEKEKEAFLEKIKTWNKKHKLRE